MPVIRSQRGFSLIELMVTLVLLAILLAAAIPSFGNWIANSRVRSVAEELQNGLRSAQTEAVRRNRQVVFGLTNETPALGATPAADGANWFVRALPVVAGEPTTDFYLGGGNFGQRAGVAVTGPALVCFNSVGRQVANAATGLGANCAPADPIIYNVSRTGSDRAMRVQVFLGGRIRLCDPAKSIATQPDGC